MPTRQVTVRTPAKVNLDLSVGGLDENGFHKLSTIFHAVDLVDDVTVREAPDWSVEVLGPYASVVPVDDSNLALRAVKLIAQWSERRGGPCPPAVHVSIDKSIPVAGGMAGGSADAAGALVAMNELFDLGAELPDLTELAAQLGSDVPFGLVGGTALGSGRGDEVVPVLTSAKYHWVFAMHDEGLSTPKVFRKFDELFPESAHWEPTPNEDLLVALRSGDPGDLAPLIHNDLERPALELLPRLQQTLDTGRSNGALAGFVSGSGPTVAFLVESRTSALDLMVALAASGVCDNVVSATSHPGGARVHTVE